MGKLRNFRHEQFVGELLACEFNQAEAYRRVYPAVRRDVARMAASRLLTSVIVKRRLEERQMALLRKQDITVDRILNEYEEARELAISQAKPEAMMAASEKKAKLVGLLVDRKEVGNVGDFEGMNDPAEIIARVSLEAGPQAAEAIAKALGLVPDDIGTDLYEIETEGNA